MFFDNPADMGPVPFEAQEGDLKKKKMLAQMLQGQAQQAGQNASPDAASGGLNIANGLIAGLGAGYLAQKNSGAESAIGNEKQRRLAQLLGGGAFGGM